MVEESGGPPRCVGHHTQRQVHLGYIVPHIAVGKLEEECGAWGKMLKSSPHQSPLCQKEILNLAQRTNFVGEAFRLLGSD